MKLLVAVDLSESTETIVNKVEEITKRDSAKVWILHNALPEPDQLEFKVDHLEAPENLATKFHEEHRQIQDIADRLRESGLDSTALLVHGKTVEIILKEAANWDVDVIVVGTHGRGAIHQLLMGSVSEEIIHKSRYPVLVIPTHKRT